MGTKKELTLEQRLDRIEHYQRDLDQEIDNAQTLLDYLKKQQGRTGPLVPLSKTLRYHHQMNNGWDSLASEGCDLELTTENYLRLHTEFVNMYEVVIQYEYVVQCLLGIQPSPGADVGDDEPEEYLDELTGVQMTVLRDMREHPKITVICPEQRILSLEQINAALGRLRQRARIDPDMFPDVLASELK